MAEESRDSKGALKKIEADKKAAEKMRKEALERFGKTKKDLKLRVIIGGRPNEGRVEMMQGSFFEGKNSGEKSVSSRRTCHKETTTTRSCKTGSDFSYNAAAMKTLIDRLLPKKS